VPRAVSLPQWLREKRAARQRRQLASALGQMLARLHARGVTHGDLYARHVLVDVDGRIVLIDWQRSGRATAGQRRRDLAAVHATLDESLVSRRERLVCVRTYLGRQRATSYQLSAISRQAHRLLSRRHVREKRQSTPAEQAWLCLDGEALCVTPRMMQL